jgi:transcription initiation factor TFIIB
MQRGYSQRAVLLYVGSELERMGEALDASGETVVDAIKLCGDVLRSEYDYSSLDAIAGACFHLACKRRDEPIALPDTASQARKSRNRVQRESAQLVSELDVQMTPKQPDTYLEAGIEQFDLTEAQAAECFELLERGRDQNLHSGLAPTTVAGAIIYAVSEKHDLGINQKEIGELVSKTDVSIRKYYKSFLELADDVPVDVLPPQTTDEALSTLQTKVTRHPSSYAEEARRLVAETDVSGNVSPAGFAGGAYLAVVERHDVWMTADEVSSALGVAVQTVRQHKRTIQRKSDVEVERI